MSGRGTPGPVVTPSGFFVLRTPLLPFAEVTAWGDGLQAPGAVDDPGVLGEAVVTDRGQLRRRLEDIVTTPKFGDALFVASPGLAAAVDLWRKEPDSDKGRAAERSLVSTSCGPRAGLPRSGFSPGARPGSSASAPACGSAAGPATAAPTAPTSTTRGALPTP